MTAKQRSHQVPPLKSGHLLGIAGLGVDEMNALLDRSSFFADIITSPDQPDSDVGKILQGVTVVNLFFENSTRTRVSFEVAAKKLG
ncbi:MAG: aspartate carbamoyltransferase catalytic subunit, partial [Candidatus Puniceispirillaceae bacterium]